jgi:4-hydroxy-tetrahydrodipicolinate synthase
MASITLMCRTATTFDTDKKLDEPALAAFLERLVEANHGLYLGSGGSGEGHALSPAELTRVYQVGVEVAAGKVPAGANPPEQHTASATVDHAELAIKAGVDLVNVYGPTTWHGFKPTEAELEAYFDEVLGLIRHPVALAPNPIIGYTPSAPLIARLCDRHHQVQSVNLAGLRDDYFLRLKDALRRDVDIYVPFRSSVHTLGLGAAGLLGAEANILPRTFARYLALYQSGDLGQLADVYAELLRFSDFVGQWQSASPRWLKMAMTVLVLPGAAGGARSPYQAAPEAELARFRAGLESLEVREIRERLNTVG